MDNCNNSNRYLVKLTGNISGTETSFTVNDYGYCPGGVVFYTGNKETFIPYIKIAAMEVEDMFNETEPNSESDSGSLDRL